MFGLNLNAAGYEIIVEQHLLPFINAHGPLHVVQDNSPTHTAKQSIDVMTSNDISIIKLPAYSPDINVIECLWHALKNYIRKKPCHTVHAMQKRVSKFFRYKVNSQILENYFDHFLKVLDEIILRQGDWTDF